MNKTQYNLLLVIATLGGFLLGFGIGFLSDYAILG
jgi:hypothetical protein